MPALRDSLTAPSSGPSTERPTWVAPEDLADCVSCATTVNLADVAAAVTNSLYVLSGRRWKQRRITVRPAPRVSQCWCVGYTGEGFWTSRDTFADAHQLHLHGPVQSIQAVKVDGVTLDPGDFRLYDAKTLVRADGGAWPLDQALGLDDDQAGTFSVAYTWGQVVPPEARIAAKAWACWMASQLAVLASEGDCELPPNVTSLTRQGFTLSRLDAYDFLIEGKTGVTLVDQWLTTVNPRRRTRRSTFASPDNVRGMKVS